MSASLSPTIASVPSGTQSATNLLAAMAALTGVNTDIVVGSQIRTLAETIGAVTEESGIANQALAFQALAYSAMSLFGIQLTQSIPASGLVTFATSLTLSGAPVASQAVLIPSGTLVQTNGGVQFATVANAVLASGTSSVIVGAIATTAGSVGNVASGAIAGQPLNGLGYPIYAVNTASMTGGSNAGTQSQALANFTSKSQSLGLSSPVAVANSVIGLVASGTGEVVNYASVYEPWIAAGSGAGSGTAGFTLYVDNGTGAASPTLLAAVTSYINGSVTQGLSGYRPVGVPYQVSGATPVYCTVAVTGVLEAGLLSSGSVAATMTSGITSYFNSIGFQPAAAYQPQIAGVAADSAASSFSSLTVNLFYSGSGSAVPVVTGAVGTRVILAGISLNLSVASS